MQTGHASVDTNRTLCYDNATTLNHRKIYPRGLASNSTRTMSQCLGRFVKDTPKGVNMLSFEEGGLFHLPIRCEMITRSKDLCDSCRVKEQRTAESVKSITGTTIGGTHPSYLMGRVTEPIPFWSRLYDGEWFRLKIKEGYTLSEGSMAKIKVAVAKAYDGVEQVAPVAKPGRKPAAESSTPVKTIKKPAKTKVEVETALEQLPVVSTPQPAPVKKRAPVKNVQAAAKVEGILDVSEHDVVQIKVRKQEVDGRMFYLDSKKDKLYDMKFKYVGRLKSGAIVAHPDSDADI